MVGDRYVSEPSREWYVLGGVSSLSYRLAAQRDLELFGGDEGVVLVAQGRCYVSPNNQDLSLMGQDSDAMDPVICVLSN